METFKRFTRHRGAWLGLGIWILAGLVALGDHFELNKSEWASWVQAVGSIAAIGGAVWIYQNQVQTQRDDASVIAKLASARIAPRIEYLIDEFELVLARLNNYEVIDVGPDELRAIYDLIARPPDWNLEDLSRLAPLPDDGALHLANGLGMLTALRLFMRDAIRNPGLIHSNPFRTRTASEAAMKLNGALNQLHIATLAMKHVVPIM